MIQSATPLLRQAANMAIRAISPAGDLPAGPPLHPVGQLLWWGERPIHFMESCQELYGDTFSVHFAGQPRMVFVSHPDAVKQVFNGDPLQMLAGRANRILEPLVGANSLLLLDGQRHLRERKLMLPAFHGERMQTYGQAISSITRRAIEGWPLGSTFPIHDSMQAITLEVILDTVFGMSAEPERAALESKIAEVLDLSINPMWLQPWAQVDLGGLTPWHRISVLNDEIDRMLYAQIARGREDLASGRIEGRSDVLAMLLAAKDEAGEPMTPIELRDEMVTLLVAGHETTATALSWAFEQILSHPDLQADLRKELKEVVGDGPLQPSQLGRLELLDATIKETLRLRPIIPVIGRILESPTTIGGHLLPAGVMVVPCIYLSHRRPERWPQPAEFRPSRFLTDKPSPHEFFPFGGGVRRCIGMAFAMYEMKIVLAEALLARELALEPGYKAKVTRRSITFAPSRGTPVRVSKRKA